MEIIVFLVLAFFAWKLLFWVLCIVFPGYGERRMMARYQENPSEANFQALSRASKRLSRRLGH